MGVPSAIKFFSICASAVFYFINQIYVLIRLPRYVSWLFLISIRLLIDLVAADNLDPFRYKYYIRTLLSLPNLKSQLNIHVVPTSLKIKLLS